MLCLALALVQETYAPDAEGFIRNWLVLAPIPCDNENNGAVEIDAQQVKEEAKLRPRAGDRAKDLSWTAHPAPAYYIDFLAAFGKERREYVVGYAVAYVRADAEAEGIQMRIGSNDMCKAYLNGVQVLRFDEGRTLEKDQNVVNVGLRKGVNTVILKVINESNQWQGCVRFTSKDGAPVKNLKVTLEP